MLEREKWVQFFFLQFCYFPSLSLSYPESTLANATTVIVVSAASSTPASTAGPNQSVKNPSCLVRIELERHRKMKSA